MRILRLAQHLYPDTKGGGQYHVHALSRDQAALGHEVTVLTTNVGDLPTVEETSGYRVVRIPQGLSVLGNHLSPGIARYLLNLDPGEYDVIHAHSHLYFSTNLAAFLGPLREIPLAITNHGLYSQSAPEQIFGWYLRTLGRWTLNRADVVFCYTRTDAKWLRDLGVTTRVAIVPNGIDTDRFTPAGTTSDRITGEGPAILFVGRLVEGKRPADAIRSVQRLRAQLEDATLYICGDGPRRAQLEELAGPETVFLGHVAYDEMPALYRAANALVLPSRAEGTPRTVLEALATGTPVACSDVENLRAAFGDDVAYFPPGDVAAAASVLGDILQRDNQQKPAVPRDWSETVAETTDFLVGLVTETTVDNDRGRSAY